MAPLACTVAFASFSPWEVFAVVLATLAAFVVAYFTGRDDGRVETRTELFKNARDNGVDPRWLQPVVQLEGDEAE